MTYKEATEYINSLKNRGIVPGLSVMRRLCDELGNPQDKVKTIHIAGTNGKGSVGSLRSDKRNVKKVLTKMKTEIIIIYVVGGK